MFGVVLFLKILHGSTWGRCSLLWVAKMGPIWPCLPCLSESTGEDGDPTTGIQGEAAPENTMVFLSNVTTI